MIWLTGRTERQLVTALLILALLMSCGIAGRAQEAEGPTIALDPTVEPTTLAELPSATASAPVVATSARPSVATPPAPPSAVPPTATVAPTATATRKPSTSALTTNRLITYYGHPYSDKMGILGEFDPEPMIAKLKEQTAAYTAADPSLPGLCTIELIASVAQGSPGADGLWLLRTPGKEIEKYAQLAEKHGCLLMLDIQMGYDTVANDIAAIMPFLQRPYVHLAIDPEFHVDKGETPGEHYGHVSAADVNNAQQVLGNLVRQFNLPDKILIVHQFRDDMLPDKENIKQMPNVDFVLMMDGWGGPGSKINNYNYFVQEQLIQYGGLKLFYRQDEPVMTPAEVLELDPKPMIICYQ